MKLPVFYLAFCFMVSHYARETTAFLDVHPDITRNVSELITSKGYPVEEHTVVTKDGYILSLQRIPHGKDNNTDPSDKKVVLLVHGELGDGKTWFLNPPGQSLGYVLPDNGFDVWVINCRGSTYSKRHVILPVRSFAFWNWSFDEVAIYDLPATIDYILEKTGKEALYYVGYSRGDTVGFILFSEIPEYNKKVKLFVALSPVTFVGHMTSIVRLAVPFAEEIVIAIKALTQGEFLPFNDFTRVVTAKFCKLNPFEICDNLIYAIGGVDKEQLNKTRVPMYLAQYPSSTSIIILNQYAQMCRSKKFRKYDHTYLGNLKKYGQGTPPDYKLYRITVPIAMFSSENDAIGNPTDVNLLRERLNTVVFDYIDDIYNHLDFIWGKDSLKRIYEPLMELLSQY